MGVRGPLDYLLSSLGRFVRDGKNVVGGTLDQRERLRIIMKSTLRTHASASGTCAAPGAGAPGAASPPGGLPGPGAPSSKCITRVLDS